MKDLIDYAKRFLGLPYVWGGSNPMVGFDCSGFVQWVLESVGADPKGDQTAQSLYDALTAQGAVRISTFQPGAIVFYGKSPFGISHVSICVSENQVIEAGGGGHTTLNPTEAAKVGACVRLRPVDHRADRIAIVMPKYSPGIANG